MGEFSLIKAEMQSYGQICREYWEKVVFLLFFFCFLHHLSAPIPVTRPLFTKERQEHWICLWPWVDLIVLAFLLSSAQVLILVISKLSKLCVWVHLSSLCFWENNSLTTWHLNSGISIVFNAKDSCFIRNTINLSKDRAWAVVSSTVLVSQSTPYPYHCLTFTGLCLISRIPLGKELRS